MQRGQRDDIHYNHHVDQPWLIGLSQTPVIMAQFIDVSDTAAIDF